MCFWRKKVGDGSYNERRCCVYFRLKVDLGKLMYRSKHVVDEKKSCPVEEMHTCDFEAWKVKG